MPGCSDLGMRSILVILVAAASLALSGCGCGGSTRCAHQPGWGICGDITACSCPTLCPGFCWGHRNGGVPPPVLAPASVRTTPERWPPPCPGLCANDAGTLATPCEGG